MKIKMKKGFAPLIILATIALSLLSGYIGAKLLSSNPSFGANFNVSGGGTYRLKSTVAPADTTIHLSSFKEPISLLPYSMTYLNTDTAYGTLDPQQPTRSEFIAFTGITQNSDGSADLTGVTRGVPRTPGNGGCSTASTTLEQAHAGQSIFILSDSPCVFSQYAAKTNNELIPSLWTASSTNPWRYDLAWGELATSTSLKFTYNSWVGNNFVDKYSNQTILGVKTFSSLPTIPLTPSASTDAASKGYVDTGVLAGCANSTQTVKGCVELATAAEINAGTATGGTGAALVLTPDQFVLSNFGTPITTVTTVLSANTSTSTIDLTACAAKSTVHGTFSMPIASGLSTTTALTMTISGDTGVRYPDNTGTLQSYYTLSNNGDARVLATGGTFDLASTSRFTSIKSSFIAFATTSGVTILTDTQGAYGTTSTITWPYLNFSFKGRNDTYLATSTKVVIQCY